MTDQEIKWLLEVAIEKAMRRGFVMGLGSAILGIIIWFGTLTIITKLKRRSKKNG